MLSIVLAVHNGPLLLEAKRVGLRSGCGSHSLALLYLQRIDLGRLLYSPLMCSSYDSPLAPGFILRLHADGKPKRSAAAETGADMG